MQGISGQQQEFQDLPVIKILPKSHLYETENRAWIDIFCLESKLQPVSPCNHRTAEDDKQDQEDKPAATAGTRETPAKAEAFLKEIKNKVQKS